MRATAQKSKKFSSLFKGRTGSKLLKLAKVCTLPSSVPDIRPWGCVAKYKSAAFFDLEPHRSFAEEVDALRDYFAPFSFTHEQQTLGDAYAGLQWFVFIAEDPQASPSPIPTSVELCCTQLAPRKAGQFFRESEQDTASAVTSVAGIDAILPGAVIDDYLFEPCGYSMNGLLDDMFITIHITPEDGQSYASVEVYSPRSDIVDKVDLLARAQAVFQAKFATVCVQHPRWKLQDSFVASPPETAWHYDTQVGKGFGQMSVTQLSSGFADSSSDIDEGVRLE